jgi:hypothetical protein
MRVDLRAGANVAILLAAGCECQSCGKRCGDEAEFTCRRSEGQSRSDGVPVAVGCNPRNACHDKPAHRRVATTGFGRRYSTQIILIQCSSPWVENHGYRHGVATRPRGCDDRSTISDRYAHRHQQPDASAFRLILRAPRRIRNRAIKVAPVLHIRDHIRHVLRRNIALQAFGHERHAV